MMKNLLELYNSYHPEFLESLNHFSKSLKEQIIKKLKNENNKIQFQSTLTEIQFGLLFQKNGFGIEYEKRYANRQEPDWVISFQNSIAIFEVYRLGTSEKDKQRNDFQNELREN